MRFGVLGPLELHDSSGSAVPLTSAKQRLLLAVLLAARNTRVSMDRLLETLWDGRPPASARTNLHGYVHRLRRLLGDDQIIRHQSGYELVVGPDDTDDTLFERLADEGRRALDDGDALRAADLLNDALKLWRGTVAYADVDQIEAVQVEAARLNELRLVASELRVDAGLKIGQHDILISELTTLVASHPLRQRPYVQLMLALHRAGRTAEALEVYRRARTVMVEELGLEPSPELRDVEQAILAEDPSLGAREACATV
jgi:DNA-binding SARP family transcriptional activator